MPTMREESKRLIAKAREGKPPAKIEAELAELEARIRLADMPAWRQKLERGKQWLVQKLREAR